MQSFNVLDWPHLTRTKVHDWWNRYILPYFYISSIVNFNRCLNVWMEQHYSQVIGVVLRDLDFDRWSSIWYHACHQKHTGDHGSIVHSSCMTQLSFTPNCVFAVLIFLWIITLASSMVKGNGHFDGSRWKREDNKKLNLFTVKLKGITIMEEYQMLHQIML